MSAYTISRNGEQYGPYGESELLTHINDGQVLATDLAWKDGMATWLPISQIFPSGAENQRIETTDSWSWGKIIKHVLLPKPKGSPKAGAKEISARVGMTIVFGLITLNLFLLGTSLPACDQKETTALVGQIVNDIPLVKIANASFVSLRNVSEQGHNKDSGVRACSATLVTTAGEDNFQYSVKWRNKKDGDFEVEGQIIY